MNEYELMADLARQDAEDAWVSEHTFIPNSSRMKGKGKDFVEIGVDTPDE